MQPEQPPTGEPRGIARRYLALDSLRGICACAVVLYHLPTTGFITNSALIRGGWMFVDFFFVLSGFVIAAGYVTRLGAGFPVRTFMMLRLGRVYPLHIAMLLLYLAAETAAALLGDGGGLVRRTAFSDGRDLPSWLVNALLLQIFGIDDTLTWNIPSWSIAAEVWTYLLMALAVAWLGAGRRLLILVAAAVGVAVVLLGALGPPYLDRTFSGALIRCVYGFGLGMLGYRVHHGFAERHRLGTIAGSLAEIATVAVCLLFVCVAGHSIVTLACPPLFLLAVLVFARQEGVVSAMLRRRAPVLLGTLSYSIYMIHHFVEARFLDMLGLAGWLTGVPLVGSAGREGRSVAAAAPLADLLALAGLGLVIACSIVTYRLVEEPCRRWSRHVAMRRQAGSTETVAPSL